MPQISNTIKLQKIDIEKIKEYPLLRNFQPLHDSVLIFEPPFEEESIIITNPNQKTQHEKVRQGYVVKVGKGCKLNIQEGSIVLYEYEYMSSNRLGRIGDVPKTLNRKEEWYKNEASMLACHVLVKETNIMAYIEH